MIIWIDELYGSAIAGRVEVTSAFTYDNLMALVAERSGYGYRATEDEGLDAKELLEIDLYVQDGYREWLLSYVWSFLEPRQR